MAMNLKLKGMPYQAFYHGLLLARRSDGRLYQSRAGTILYGLFLAFLLRCNLLMSEGQCHIRRLCKAVQLASCGDHEGGMRPYANASGDLATVSTDRMDNSNGVVTHLY